MPLGNRSTWTTARATAPTEVIETLCGGRSARAGHPRCGATSASPPRWPPRFKARARRIRRHAWMPTCRTIPSELPRMLDGARWRASTSCSGWKVKRLDPMERRRCRRKPVQCGDLVGGGRASSTTSTAASSSTAAKWSTRSKSTVSCTGSCRRSRTGADSGWAKSPVNHRARKLRPESKFGAARFVNGFLDLLSGGVHLDLGAQTAARVRADRRRSFLVGGFRAQRCGSSRSGCTAIPCACGRSCCWAPACVLLAHPVHPDGPARRDDREP